MVVRGQLSASLCQTMGQYCINNNKDKELEEQMIAVECDIFYLSDILSIIFENYNLFSKLILLSCKDAINSFFGKLKLFWGNIGRREYLHVVGKLLTS